jgi:acyl dehydratase
LYFEQFEIDDEVVTSGRTITETDIVNFAGLTGDFNAIHTNAVHAAQDTFGKRVAHGMLIHSIASGLAVQTGIIEGTVMAFRELSAKFSLPVFIGDTIHVKLVVTEKKALRRLGGGNITMKVSVLNQDDKVVQRGEWVMLVKSEVA